MWLPAHRFVSRAVESCSSAEILPPRRGQIPRAPAGVRSRSARFAARRPRLPQHANAPAPSPFEHGFDTEITRTRANRATPHDEGSYPLAGNVFIVTLIEPVGLASGTRPAYSQSGRIIASLICGCL